MTGRYWRVFVCISYIESRWELGVSNGGSYGPWEINVPSHAWASPWLLTHSWLYSARAAWRVSGHGSYWQPFEPDAANCGA